MKNNFLQGYVCAVANLLRERDLPVIAEGLLESLGTYSIKTFKEAGVQKEDIQILKKYKLIK